MTGEEVELILRETRDENTDLFKVDNILFILILNIILLI